MNDILYYNVLVVIVFVKNVYIFVYPIKYLPIIIFSRHVLCSFYTYIPLCFSNLQRPREKCWDFVDHYELCYMGNKDGSKHRQLLNIRRKRICQIAVNVVATKGHLERWSWSLINRSACLCQWTVEPFLHGKECRPFYLNQSY